MSRKLQSAVILSFSTAETQLFSDREVEDIKLGLERQIAGPVYTIVNDELSGNNLRVIAELPEGSCLVLIAEGCICDNKHNICSSQNTKQLTEKLFETLFQNMKYDNFTVVVLVSEFRKSDVDRIKELHNSNVITPYGIKNTEYRIIQHFATLLNTTQYKGACNFLQHIMNSSMYYGALTPDSSTTNPLLLVYNARDIHDKLSTINESCVINELKKFFKEDDVKKGIENLIELIDKYRTDKYISNISTKHIYIMSSIISCVVNLSQLQEQETISPKSTITKSTATQENISKSNGKER